eukprot:490022-Prymnesium_polylepis.1
MPRRRHGSRMVQRHETAHARASSEMRSIAAGEKILEFPILDRCSAFGPRLLTLIILDQLAVERLQLVEPLDDLNAPIAAVRLGLVVDGVVHQVELAQLWQRCQSLNLSTQAANVALR